MVQRSGGFRRKTRHKLKKNIRQKGKISIHNYLQEFKSGDKVLLKAEPSIQKGMYFPRFHSKVGTVTKKQGKCYKILIKDHNKEKILIVHPIHLKKV
ncbi:MAG: 50S ribosomal protein L21e [Candidatus Woesearchaeota archaeon]|nr:50S ribosomal protein L21e [Candidatus Woesearchaeota archaeon]